MLPVSLDLTTANEPARRQAVAKEFSRLFIAMMLQQAAEPVWNDGEKGLPGAGDMVQQCLAEKLAPSDPFGIARMVVESMQRQGEKPC